MLKGTKEFTVKIDPQIYFVLKEYCLTNGEKIKWHTDRALRNYLKAKRILIKG